MEEYNINVVPTAKQKTMAGPRDWFSGNVDLSMVLPKGEAPSNLSSGNVSFKPGARTAWHVHPRGQLLVVTDGIGLIQKWGESAQEMKKGDVVWIPPGVKHWHGASKEQSMTHIAIQESMDDKAVEWLEQVKDDDYNKV